MDFAYYERLVDKMLKPARAFHSKEVAKEARELALLYGADPEQAYLAGMLHDIMKNAEADEQLKIIKNSGILLDEITLREPKLWHAVAGALYIQDVLKINDPVLVDAVRYHTTGRAFANLLEQILYIADFTSKDRDYADVETVRILSRQSLAETCIYVASYTIRSLVLDRKPVHPDTLSVYNEYIRVKERENLFENKTQTQPT